ncbi:unnamed protein product [Cylindrotheca closterium]|uniref:ShKT domain-containing protein n=1 Tax=Cylindrotheca closterium TaxID=2856 RepID=A0AAD2FQI8_9STRA|nr:unnamed protein product [Cylindrotheca closterium]
MNAPTSSSEDRIDENMTCKDKRNACLKSAKDGMCRKQPDLMYRLCPESCKLCKSQERTTEFGVLQDIVGRDAYELSLIVKKTRKYIDSDAVLDLSPELFLNCWNRHRDCTRWVLQGECETNRDWMRVNCAPACQSCHLITMEQLELIGVEENRFI